MLEYVLTSQAPAGSAEVFVIIGSPDAPLLNAIEERGARFVSTLPEELFQELGIDSAPLFFVVDPDEEPRWIGGYSRRKQGLDYTYLETLEALRAGVQPESIPVYGCGVTKSLQAEIDPLGIKY